MIIILMGTMGCGKTFIGRMLSDRLQWPFHDGDDFHSETNIEKMRAGIALNDEDRKAWLEELGTNIQRWLNDGQNAVLACSALKQAYRDVLGVNQNTICTVYLKGSCELLSERIKRRKHPYMNKTLLRSQLDIIEEPSDGLTVDVSLSPDRIVETIVEHWALGQSAQGPATPPQE